MAADEVEIEKLRGEEKEKLKVCFQLNHLCAFFIHVKARLCFKRKYPFKKVNSLHPSKRPNIRICEAIILVVVTSIFIFFSFLHSVNRHCKNRNKRQWSRIFRSKF